MFYLFIYFNVYCTLFFLLIVLFLFQFLEQYGEVSMLDIKGADAGKVVLVIGIMTLHSFGEGSGVGVSFAGSKGFSQGLLVTLAIAVHNIPEGLAVSMVLASRGVSPQNAMLWSVITSLPQVISCTNVIVTGILFYKCLLRTCKCICNLNFSRENPRWDIDLLSQR